MGKITVGRIAFLFLLPLFAQALIAQDQPNDRKAPTPSSELSLQISTLPEIKLGFTNRYTIPFLQGESPLTQDNNISLALGAEVSPISLNGLAEAVWTPIAFFQLTAGGRIGSGWNLKLFGSDLYGIGLNVPDVVGKSINDGGAFDGLLWKVQTGGTVQFDLAALFPGDWNHVVALSYHEINYKGYTRAKAEESWFYENDGGENINGFNYYGNMLIGYQMPMFFNMAALLAETDLYLYNTPGREMWGDDKLRWTFSGIFGFTVTRQIDINLIAQFTTQRNYLEQNWRDLYYRNRTIDSSAPLGLKFYRVAAALTYRL
ncbi:MAG: hypothetical protein LBQ94_09010 [Treponema sp.]|jgi:hypothetical protein|nr:hypothetical protein [Treponema sp.]